MNYKDLNIQTIIENQKKLDDRIIFEHQIVKNNSYLEKKLLAFSIELSEFANETRIFKYWSNKPSSPRNVMIEEYVDGLHFLVSIGIDLDINFNWVNTKEYTPEKNVVLAFVILQSKIYDLYKNQNEKNYMFIMDTFLNIGASFGFTPRDVYDEYLAKNNKNHIRQDNKY